MNEFHKYAAKRHLTGLVKEALYGRKFLEAYRRQAGLTRANGSITLRNFFTPTGSARRAAATQSSPLGAQLNELSRDAASVASHRRISRQAVLDGDLERAEYFRDSYLQGKKALQQYSGPKFKAEKKRARELLGLPDRSGRSARSATPAAAPAPASRSVFDRIRDMF